MSKRSVTMGALDMVVEVNFKKRKDPGYDLEFSFYPRVNTPGCTKVNINCVTREEMEQFINEVNACLGRK